MNMIGIATCLQAAEGIRWKEVYTANTCIKAVGEHKAPASVRVIFTHMQVRRACTCIL